MEERNKHIDDLFREELSGYREAPPPPVWDALERRLDADDRRKRMVPFFWRRWGLALLLLCLFTTGYMAYQHFSNGDEAHISDAPAYSTNTGYTAPALPVGEAKEDAHPTGAASHHHTQAPAQQEPDRTLRPAQQAGDQHMTMAQPTQQNTPAAVTQQETAVIQNTTTTTSNNSNVSSSNANIIAAANSHVKDQAATINRKQSSISSINNVAKETAAAKQQEAASTSLEGETSANQAVVAATSIRDNKTQEAISQQSEPKPNTLIPNTSATVAMNITVTGSGKVKENEGNREIKYTNSQPKVQAAKGEAIAKLQSRKAVVGNKVEPDALAMAKSVAVVLPQAVQPIVKKTKRGRKGAATTDVVIVPAASATTTIQAKAKDETPINLASTEAKTTDGLGGATAPTAPPQKKNRGWNLPVDLGVKGGYERGIASAQGFFVAPYVQWRASQNMSLIFQPGFRLNNVTQPMQLLDETAFHRVVSNTMSTNNDDSFSLSGPGYYRRFFYSEKYDSVIVSALIKKQRYMEIELPITMQYQLSKQFSVFGGLSLTLGKIIKIDEVRKEYGGFTKSGRFVSEVDSTGNAIVQPPAYQTFFANSYNTQNIDDYRSRQYSNPTTNPMRFGYSIGASYTPNERWMFEASMRQNLSDLKTSIPNDQVRKFYTQPYFRVGVGYKIFVAKERK